MPAIPGQRDADGHDAEVLRRHLEHLERLIDEAAQRGDLDRHDRLAVVIEDYREYLATVDDRLGITSPGPPQQRR